jgi:mono/diheme cytochrome c family protein
MSTRSPAAAVLLSSAFAFGAASAIGAETPNLGRPVTLQDIAPWDISVAPDGTGLPSGSGTVAQGEMVYVAACQGCHGERGVGKPNDQLVGGQGSLAANTTPIKTVGSFWPYATTLFDYIRRAMPLNAPKSLTDDQVYAVCAYILQLNGSIGANDTMDARSLPAVRMPNRDGFIAFTRSQ